MIHKSDSANMSDKYKQFYDVSFIFALDMHNLILEISPLDIYKYK